MSTSEDAMCVVNNSMEWDNNPPKQTGDNIYRALNKNMKYIQLDDK